MPTKKLHLWVRVGNGEYENFGQDFDSLADYLHECGINVSEVVWLKSPDGLTTSRYDGDNYVSLYWGDEEANLEKIADQK